MTKRKVPMQLYQKAQFAAENIYRYDRIERYVLNQILLAAEKNQQTDSIYINCAEKFLDQYSSENSKTAA